MHVSYATMMQTRNSYILYHAPPLPLSTCSKKTGPLCSCVIIEHGGMDACLLPSVDVDVHTKAKAMHVHAPPRVRST